MKPGPRLDALVAAKVMEYALEYVGPDGQPMWNVGPTPSGAGRVLIGLKQFQPSVDDKDAMKAWDAVDSDSWWLGKVGPHFDGHGQPPIPAHWQVRTREGDLFTIVAGACILPRSGNSASSVATREPSEGIPSYPSISRPIASGRVRSVSLARENCSSTITQAPLRFLRP